MSERLDSYVEILNWLNVAVEQASRRLEGKALMRADAKRGARSSCWCAEHWTLVNVTIPARDRYRADVAKQCAPWFERLEDRARERELERNFRLDGGYGAPS